MTDESTDELERTCPECGHEYDPDADPEPEDDGPQEPIGECEDCGVPIYHGEWHVADLTDYDDLPDESIQSVQVGEPDPTTRWCGPCSDRPLSDFPDDLPTAGVDG